MSADPPRKAYKYTCSMIRPQIYSEKSLMESVVDFFSDVVPQAYSGTQRCEDKEKIQWVRFENCDCNDVTKNPDMFRSDTKGLPLLLILGYSNGVQIWHITPNGEAQELLSLRQGPVRICRVLPNPDPVLGAADSFSSKRPLMIMCDSSSAGQPYCGVKFVSLKTGDEVHSISFKTLPVQNIECNKRFIALVFLEKICVHEACNFKQLFWVTSCFPCPGPNGNPIAMSSRWLAYADKRLVAMHQSCGGMSGDGSQSYAATVISAAKGAIKGLSMFGEAMVSSVTGAKVMPPKRDFVQLDNGNRPGIVTVVDIQNVHNDHFNVNEDNEGHGLIAHFHAHANEPVSHMTFDPTGTLLVTACKLGHNFHVFRLMAHPVSSSLGAVHHLYTLHRGETTAKVIDIHFNHDSRWVTVSSHRGTTHLFPITPYGGPVNVRTHCSPHVVNRASRFHRSAGLDEFEHSHVGRRSPILSTSPSSLPGQYDRYPTLIQQNTLNNNMGNPRLPPYPHPITVYPAFQIKQPLNVVLNPSNKNQSPSHSPTGQDNVYSVCAKFCTPRLCVVGSPKLDVDRRDAGKRLVDSLFVMAQSGTLVEYVLVPCASAKTVSDKVTDDCLLELQVTGRMQWNLQRLKNSLELRPPLPSNSPLILAHEAVTSQVPTAPDLYDMPGLTRQDSKDSLSSDHSNKDESDEQWVAHVEIITHAGPHRRLWMGPQFSFKTYQENTTVLSSNSSALLSQSPESNMVAMDMAGDEGDLESLKLQPTRSNPVSMPNARPAYRRLSGSDSSPSPGPGIGQPTGPLLIEAGSFDQSPHLLDVYSNWTESTVAKQPRGSDDLEEDRLKETLADAMVESPNKEIEKLSLRQQEIPRASVRSEADTTKEEEPKKRRGQSQKKAEKVKGTSKSAARRNKEQARKERRLSDAIETAEQPKLSESDNTSNTKLHVDIVPEHDSSVIETCEILQERNDSISEAFMEISYLSSSHSKESLPDNYSYSETTEQCSPQAKHLGQYLSDNDRYSDCKEQLPDSKSVNDNFCSVSILVDDMHAIVDSELEHVDYSIEDEPSVPHSTPAYAMSTSEHSAASKGRHAKNGSETKNVNSEVKTSKFSIELKPAKRSMKTREASSRSESELPATDEVIDNLKDSSEITSSNPVAMQTSTAKLQTTDTGNSKKGKQSRKKNKKQSNESKTSTEAESKLDKQDIEAVAVNTTREKVADEIDIVTTRDQSSMSSSQYVMTLEETTETNMEDSTRYENNEYAATEDFPSLKLETEVRANSEKEGIEIPVAKKGRKKKKGKQGSPLSEPRVTKVEMPVSRGEKKEKSISPDRNEAELKDIKVVEKVGETEGVVADAEIRIEEAVEVDEAGGMMEEMAVSSVEKNAEGLETGGPVAMVRNSEVNIVKPQLNEPSKGVTEAVVEVKSKRRKKKKKNPMEESVYVDDMTKSVYVDDMFKSVYVDNTATSLCESIPITSTAIETADVIGQQKSVVETGEITNLEIDTVVTNIEDETINAQDVYDVKHDEADMDNENTEMVAVGIVEFERKDSEIETKTRDESGRDNMQVEADNFNFIAPKKKNRKKKKNVDIEIVETELEKNTVHEIEVAPLSGAGLVTELDTESIDIEIEMIEKSTDELERTFTEEKELNKVGNDIEVEQAYLNQLIAEIDSVKDMSEKEMSDSMENNEAYEEAREDGKSFDSETEGDSRYETADDESSTWDKTSMTRSLSVSKSNSESSDIGKFQRMRALGADGWAAADVDSVAEGELVELESGLVEVESEMSKITIVATSSMSDQAEFVDVESGMCGDKEGGESRSVTQTGAIGTVKPPAVPALQNYSDPSSGSNRSSEEKEEAGIDKVDVKKQETKTKKKKKKNRK